MLQANRLHVFELFLDCSLYTDTVTVCQVVVNIKKEIYESIV